MDTLSLFVSSPGDVNEERIITERVLKRLAEEFSSRVCLEPVFWEHEPMLATGTFQTQIPAPEKADIFICILWAKMGTRLPSNITRPDGSRYESGTEYEFENAIASFSERGRPDLLIYRKMAEPPFLHNSRAADFAAKLAQKEALDVFFRKWFQDEEGSFTSAFNPFDDLAQFEERLETHLRKLLERRYPSDGSKIQRMVSWKEGSPFCGLSAFDQHHAAVFFGRTKAIGEVLSALRKQAQEQRDFVLILGMSGSGKSSLVRAGVLPLLTSAGVIEGVGYWQQAEFRPSDSGEQLLEGLAKALLAAHALPCLQEPVAERIALQNLLKGDDDEALCEFVAHRLAHSAEEKKLSVEQVHLVILVDQLEEIFTLEKLSREQRLLFSRALKRLLALPQVWGLGTMRSDFYHHCATLPDLLYLIEGNGQYLLPSPGVSEIGQMIRLPAFAAGLQFESRDGVALDDTLLDAMAQNPQNLALLEFTLEALYQQRTEDGMLSFEAYERMGGVEGALAQRAEHLFGQLPQAVREVAPTLLRALVTVEQDENAPVTSRAADYEALSEDPQVRALMEAFIQARLLVTDQADNGRAVVRVSHEALLHHWPRIRNQLAQDRVLLRIRGRIASAAQYWQAEGKMDSLLLGEGKPLVDAQELYRQWEAVLEPKVVEFIEASQEAVERRRQEKARAALREQQRRANLRRSRIISISFALLSLVAMVGGYFGYQGQEMAESQRQQAEQERDRARASEDLAEQERDRARQARRQALRTQSLYLSSLAQQEIDQGNATNAILLALEALPETMHAPEKDFVPEAETVLYNGILNQYELAVLGPHESAVLQIAADRKGERLLSLTQRGQVRLWDIPSQRRLRLLRGHTRPVNALAVHPQEALFATASWDGTARLWSAEGEELHVLHGHSSGISSVHFSPDGKQVLTTSYDRSARLWSTDTGALLHGLYGHQNDILQACFSPDGKRVATSSRDNNVILWRVADGAMVQIYRQHLDWVEHLAFSPDGKTVLSGSKTNELHLWEADTGRQLLRFSRHRAPLQQAMFSIDGKLILSVSGDGQLYLWSSRTGMPVYEREGVAYARFTPDNKGLAQIYQDDKRIYLVNLDNGNVRLKLNGHTAMPHTLAFNEMQGRLFSASEDRTVRLWRMQGGQQEKLLNGPSQEISYVAFSPDGTRLIGVGRDQRAYLWEPGRSHEPFYLDGHGSGLYHASFSADGSQVATTAADGEIILWDASNGYLQYRLQAHENWVYRVNYSPDNQYLVSASWDKHARIWDVRNGRLLHDLEHPQGVFDAVFNLDGDIVATGARDGTVRLWQTADGSLKAELPSAHGSVHQLSFSPDGKLLASVARHHVMLWDAASGGLAHTLSGHDSYIFQAAFDPLNRYLATTSEDGTLRLWNLADGSSRLEFNLAEEDSYILRLAFSPDGNRLVGVGRNLKLYLWDVETGQRLVEMQGHGDLVRGLSFSPLGNYIATGSRDGSVRLWRVFNDTQNLIDYARQQVPRALTPTQRKQFFLE